MRRFAFSLLLVFGACASSRVVIPSDSVFSGRDYLHTAWETLGQADPDTGGHRIRAQLATRAAIVALGDGPARRVPFEGPPTLAVALELLERSEPEVAQNAEAQTHTRRALAELREALR